MPAPTGAHPCPALRVPRIATSDQRFAALDEVVRGSLGKLYPGAVLLVAHRATVVHAAAFGDAQSLTLDRRGDIAPLDPPRPMTVRTIHDIASMTKIMATTAAIMRLVDSGRLGLDDRLGDLLPAFANGDKAAITVRHLLAHRAGLWEWQPAWRHLDAEGSALPWLAALPLRYPVGARHAYSDLGFMLLGAIVTRVSGLPLDRYAQQELFDPLGMTDTGFLPSRSRRRRMAATSRGDLYQRRMEETGHPWSIVQDPPPQPFSAYRTQFLLGETNDLNAHAAWGGVAGHAGLFSTAPDVARFAQLILNEGCYGGHQLIAPDTIAQFLETPWDPEQALGFRVLRLNGNGPTFYHHPGYTGTSLHLAPELDLSLTLLTNRVHRGGEETTPYPGLDGLREKLLSLAVEAVGPG